MPHHPTRLSATTSAGSAARDVALQLSGRMHGGLIIGLDGLATQANDGYCSGRYAVGATILYVNNGIVLWLGFACGLDGCQN